jgi:hypothetical protein
VSTVSGGVIHRLSVSQVESFDPAQTGGCPRRWWFERVQGYRPEKTEAHQEGDIGHELLAHYLATGEAPKGRVKMGKAVTGAIAAGHLPTPGPDLLVERRFDGQPKRDARGDWIPLDVDATLKVGGVPWDGFVDLRFRRGDVVDVLDHKFSSDIHAYARPADSLIRTVQMPVYCLDSLRIWPDARAFRLTHHYVSRRGVESFVRSQVVTVDQVWAREAQVRTIVADMRDVAQATSQDDVPFNRRACMAWQGCPHQSICSAFKENRMQLTAEEAALFGDLDTIPAPSQPKGGQHRTPTLNPDAGHGAGDTQGGTDYPDVPMPVASVPQAQPALVCDACGTELHAENGSRRNDRWTHIGCPAAVTSTPPAASTESAPARGRGRPPGSRNKPKPEAAPSPAEVKAMGEAAVAVVLESVAGHEALAEQLAPEVSALAGAQTQRFQSAGPNPPGNGPKEDAEEAEWARGLPEHAHPGTGKLLNASPIRMPAARSHTVSGGLELRVLLDVSPAMVALVERLFGKAGRS